MEILYNFTEELKKYGLTTETYEALLKDCSDKAQKISDVDWNDIVEKYNLNVHYDTLRKSSQFITGGSFVSEYFKWKESQRNSDDKEDSYFKELRLQRQETQKEIVKLRDERNELRRIIREEARKESYKDQFLRNIVEYQGQPLEYEENARFKGVLKTDNDLLISLFDIHAGMESNNFFNTYNQDVLKDRLNEYLDKIFEVQIRHGSENAYLVLSETISGFIHPTLRIENNQDMIEQFLMITDYLSQFIRELSYHFNEVNVYMAIGNHGRLSPKKDDNLTHENMDNLVLPFLEAKLQNFDNVICHKNDIEDTIAMFAIRGTNVFSSHGDRETPQNAIQKLTLFTGTRPDIYLCGHRHTNAMSTVYDAKILQAGCLSGADSYCMDKRLKNKPEQLLAIVNNKGLDCIYDVKFDK